MGPKPILMIFLFLDAQTPQYSTNSLTYLKKFPMMVRFWSILGLFLIYFWSVFGLFWVCFWSVFGPFWSIFGPFLVCFWSCFGPFWVEWGAQEEAGGVRDE